VPAPKYPGVAEPVDQPAAGLPRERSGGPVAEQAPKTQRLPVDEAASPTPRRVAPKAARGRKTPDTGAIATQRLVARDIQDLASPPDGAPSPLTTDRDAAATQRLIKRELGEFLPAPNVRSDGSSPTR